MTVFAAVAKFYSNEAAPTIKGSVQTTLKYRVNPDYDGELKLALDFNCARS